MSTIGPISSRMSRAFLVIAALMLLIGLFVFVFADSIATLPANIRANNPWPWPIGPLALRFVASLVLSAALACYLVSRRADHPTLTAFAVVATITSGMLLLHSLVNFANMNWGKPLSIIWLIALIAALVGSIILLIKTRQKGVVAASALPPTPPLARHIALFIFLLTGIVGLTMFLLPTLGRE